MKKLMLFSIVMFIFNIELIAAQDLIWSNTYGGTDYDDGFSVCQSSDGGFVICGMIGFYGMGGGDVWLLKTDSTGVMIGSKIIGGVELDFGNSICETADSGFVIAGLTASYGAGYDDLYVIRTDQNGDTIWTRTYGGTHTDEGKCIRQSSDGGFIIVGSTYSFGAGRHDVYLLKIDSNGDTIWTRTYGGTEDDFGLSLDLVPNDGFIISGYTTSYGAGGMDIYLLRVDKDGDTLWTRTFGGFDNDRGFSVIRTDDGGYIVAGSTETYGAGGWDVYILKTNQNGDSLWAHTYGGANTDFVRCINECRDGGFILTGQTLSFGAGSSDVYVLKIDSDGDTLWTRTFGGANTDFGYGIQQTSAGNYIAVGGTTSFGAGADDVYLLKIEGEACLECNAICYTPRVPAQQGVLSWDLEIENCGPQSLDVYGELYPIVGDCANGTSYDFNLNKGIINNFSPGASYSGHYYLYPGNVVGFNQAAVDIYIGPAIDDWLTSCCFEFVFTYEWGRTTGFPQWTTLGKWTERNDTSPLPEKTALGQNYPNPFNAETTILFDLTATGKVKLGIYNLQGQLVETLIDDYREAGHHTVNFNASTLSSGIYFYKLQIGSFVTTKKMNLLK
ncbi:MAG: T9SS type A sorting domain-containing protein [candidate division Zixibacteria bacterium]|nr:T9SS type A sorting domain-containing protein [candidate division Zixibacteria bacterium]